MMNEAIREEKNVTSSRFKFAAELVQDNVPSDIIPACKNAAVAIWGFFDIMMHIYFVGVVSAVVHSTCTPGLTWPLGIRTSVKFFINSRGKPPNIAVISQDIG